MGLWEVDEELFAAIATAGSPRVDAGLRQLSSAANHSRLWMGTAVILAAVGGPDGRRAALRGMLAVGLTSAVVNLGFKRVVRRTRPPRGLHDANRHVRMPASTSFPSGHAASAFAFAQGVAASMPWTGLLLRGVAATVAYSRVHAGVHYPLDVVAGSVVGAALGQGVVHVLDRGAR